jgi:hypothetical protein
MKIRWKSESLGGMKISFLLPVKIFHFPFQGTITINFYSHFIEFSRSFDNLLYVRRR